MNSAPVHDEIMVERTEQYVTDHGGIGDGVADDLSAVISAYTLVGINGGRVNFLPGTYRVSDDVTIPADCHFFRGAMISPDSGKRVTFTGDVVGHGQIFVGSGTIAIERGKCLKVLPEWWGVVGNGTTDDSTAFNKCIASMTLANSCGVIDIPAGTYKLNSELYVYARPIVISGAGNNLTKLLVHGSHNGIRIDDASGGVDNEGTLIKDLRIYKDDTALTGIGISVDGTRRTTIDNVWIGGWYGANDGFAKGINVQDQAAYFVHIKGCHLQQNQYGIYAWSSANALQIDGDNVIQGGEYGVYIDGAHSPVIVNNKIEAYSVGAFYIKDAYNPVIKNNYCESNGIRTGVLAGTTANARIADNNNASQVYTLDDWVDNSDYPTTNRIEYTNIPFMDNVHILSNPVGGSISLDRDFAALTSQYGVKVKAVSGDLSLKVDKSDRAIRVGNKIYQPNIDTGFATTAIKSGNAILYSEDFNSWSKSGGTTVASNAGVAPNGTVTADFIYGTRVYQVVTETNAIGTVFNFSVWLKSPLEQVANLMINTTGGGYANKAVKLTKEWNLYNVILIGRAESSNWDVRISTINGEASNYPLYAWGAQMTKSPSVTGTHLIGLDSQGYVYCTQDIVANGIDIGGMVEVYRPIADIWAQANIETINSSIVFTGGTTAEPAFGATVTSDSGVTATVVQVRTLTGTWAGNNATGFIEVEDVNGDVTGASSWSWTGGSCTDNTSIPNNIINLGKATTATIDYENGATAAPSAGQTLTANNGATAVVVTIYPSGGSWVAGTAAGEIYCKNLYGDFANATSWTWTGGSCAVNHTHVAYNSLVVPYAGSGPTSIDDDDVYFLCSSLQRIPSYARTGASAIPHVNATFTTETIGLKSVIYNPYPDPDTADGDKEPLVAGTNLIFGDVCYMGSDGKMEKALADAIATSQVMAICLETIAENAIGLFLMRGKIHLHTIAPAWTVGSASPIYLSDTTAGGYDQVAPADTDECIIKIGTPIAADVLYFNPDSTIVVHT